MIGFNIPVSDAREISRLPERIRSKIEVRPNGCWQWTAAKYGKGYALVRWEGGNRLAHRIVYQLLRGVTPPELTCDHLCRNRACVNPWHIELVTNRKNVLRGQGITAVNARKTHCKHGHEFTEENTRWRIRDGRWRRVCRACHRQSVSRAYKALKEAADDRA